MSGERLQDHWVWNICCLSIDGADHMTKMEAMPIYGKTFKKISSSVQEILRS